MITRRRLLTTGGAAIALFPWLDAAAAPTPMRLLLVFTPHGTVWDQWRPSGGETDFTLSYILEPLAAHPHVGDIRQRGFMVGIELVADRPTREPYPAEARIGHRVARDARSRGVLLRPIGNVMVLMPPLTMSPTDLGRLVTITKDAIVAVTAERA